MHRLATKDALGGAIIFLIGLFFFVKSFDYGIGRVTAGYFPMGLGALAMAIGIAIFGSALLPAVDHTCGRTTVDVGWRALVFITAGIAGFALLIERAGLFPAVAISALLSALGTREWKPLGTAILVVGTSIGIWLVFVVGLRVPIALFHGAG